ncbi:hypothetical protein [Ornithinimicrobium cerasi]|uniref:hypothetical protein n=1 Tax=Ornithinimicrobium cerasi TaxID=2248773 RepID=UPI000EFFFFA0|nr:hypothetical protein [Ornithinimicrobium cerasi]
MRSAGAAGRAAGAGRRAIVAACVAAGVAVGVRTLHRQGRLPGGSGRWERTNHLGAPVTLTEGVALAVGTAAPLVLLDPPAALAVGGSALAGAVDDLTGGTATKGLRGHLGALRRGTVTTGALKVLVLGGTGLVACAWSDARAGRSSGRTGEHDALTVLLDTLTGAALVAGAANLANLLDLRPGRALKVALACGIPLGLGGTPTAAAVSGAGLTVLPDDLRGRSMLGDTGANPLGAAVGLAAAQTLGPRGRAAALALVAGLVLASERVSFSRVIDATPVLRALDRWGRPA